MSQDYKKYSFPIIKNDFKIINEFDYFELSLPVHSLCCIYANDDPAVNYNNVLSWKNYTNGFYYLFKVEGGHFFFEKYPNMFCRLLVKIIDEIPD